MAYHLGAHRGYPFEADRPGATIHLKHRERDHKLIHTHARTHAHTHARRTGMWISTFVSSFICFSSLSTLVFKSDRAPSSILILSSRLSTSASKSDRAPSSTLILSFSCDSLVFDSKSSWVALSCCTEENGLKRDPNNARMSRSACVPVLSKLALVAL